MATFRVHLSSDNAPAITNLITGIGEVRDSEGNAKAFELLHLLEDEIAFVKRYILDRPAPYRFVTENRVDPSMILAAKRATARPARITDSRINRSDVEAIHP